MEISLWKLSNCLLSGVFCIGGLVNLLYCAKKHMKWNRLKKRCTQKAQGVIEQELELSGYRGNGGQRVTFVYDVDKKHFAQTSDFLYKRHTFQWGQQVTVCYDPIEPTSCYLEENNRQRFFETVIGILFSIFFCIWHIFALIW